MNKPKPYIVIDVDITLVESSLQSGGWLSYLNKISRYPILYPEDLYNKEGLIDYDLSTYFPDLTKDEAFSYWRSETLYDNLNPYKEAVKVITELGQTNLITFASFSKAKHYKSKFNFIKKHFGDKMPRENWAFVSTGEKGVLKADVCIDDRNKFLNQMSTEVLKIKFKSDYTQDEELKCSLDLHTKDWYEIGKFLKETL